MIVRMDDFYRINYKGKEFDFKVLELKVHTYVYRGKRGKGSGIDG